jgi:3-deoxy-7-phosphoheptulonate synthase
MTTPSPTPTTGKDITERDRERSMPLATKKGPDHRTIVKVGDAEFGGDKFVIIAGPCAVENLELTIEIAKAVKGEGAVIYRGGAYKSLTFPYRREGYDEAGREGLDWLKAAKEATGLPLVTEVMDPNLVPLQAEYADMLQIGARNMQNFPLLTTVAKTGKPILLKRHFGCSLRDLLGAAEYCLEAGNPNVVLCERGIVAPHTHQPASRFIVDIQAVAALNEFTHLPVIVDPSHATFRREYVPPVARAALAVGADGIILDVHPRPDEAAVDPLQALSYSVFHDLMEQLKKMAPIMDRSV